jgi:hypothetical protein
MTIIEQMRLDVCRACPNYKVALRHGACLLIRDPELRVSCDNFALAIERGTWPPNSEAEAPCPQPIQDFNGRRSDGR